MKKNNKPLATALEKVFECKYESEIHAFLADRIDLFRFLNWGYYVDDLFVKSKFRLAEEFVADFVWIGDQNRANDLRPRVVFIEIELPCMRLFTKAGNPSAQLTHALRQVQNWKQWTRNNRGHLHRKLTKMIASDPSIDDRLSFVKMLLPAFAHGGFSDEYMVIAGRRTAMSVADRLLLAQMNEDMKDITILTYDTLLDFVLKDHLLPRDY